MNADMSMMNPNATMGGNLARIDESGFMDNTIDDIQKNIGVDVENPD
jgi:hypothetical protein